MKTYLDCIPCFLRQSLEAGRNVSSDPALHETILREVLKMTLDLDMTETPPAMGQAIHRRLREITGVADPYAAAKTRFNHLAMDILPELEEDVAKSADPLLAAAKFAIAANLIDLGIIASLTEDETRDALRQSSAIPLHGDAEAFHEAIRAAKDILYLADNAGEIAVDRLLIERLDPKRVTLAVRGAPVINDATRADARAVGLDTIVKEIIDNGSDAPGTILETCSATFREHFAAADLIIAKGQGNFETLSDVAANIYFLFKVKCPVIAGHVGLPLGTHVLLHATEIANLAT
ncbi:MAG: DUF89 family protein [Deltaproteobacteria bacterium]|nr:DUF89 family protein [Deltaproteobacteria bacterium]